jgi:hypothetical protein
MDKIQILRYSRKLWVINSFFTHIIAVEFEADIFLE